MIVIIMVVIMIMMIQGQGPRPGPTKSAAGPARGGALFWVIHKSVVHAQECCACAENLVHAQEPVEQTNERELLSRQTSAIS